MSNSKNVTRVNFSKIQAGWWLLIITTFYFLLIFDLYRNNNFFVGKFDEKDWALPIGGLILVWASQWNRHCLRVLLSRDPSVRIEGEDIIAFGQRFSRGAKDHIIFEKRSVAKYGYWATLRNGAEEMAIPLAGYSRVEEFIDGL